MKKYLLLLFFIFILKITFSQVAVATSENDDFFIYAIGTGANAKDTAIVKCKKKGGNEPKIYFYDYVGGYHLAICEITKGWLSPKLIKIVLGTDNYNDYSARENAKTRADTLKNAKNNWKKYKIQNNDEIKTLNIESPQYPIMKLLELYKSSFTKFENIDTSYVLGGLHLEKFDTTSFCFKEEFKMNENNFYPEQAYENFEYYETMLKNFANKKIYKIQIIGVAYSNPTEINLFKTSEYPTIELTITESNVNSTIEFVIESPKIKEPPKIKYQKDKEICGIVNKIDTLIVPEDKNNKHEFNFLFSDNSNIQILKINGIPVNLAKYRKNNTEDKNGNILQTINYNHFFGEEDNLKNFEIELTDELENKTKVVFFIILYEDNSPEITINAQRDGDFLNTYYSIYKNKNNKFVLKGAVTDETSVKSFFVNKEQIQLDATGNFKINLNTDYNNKYIQIKAIDFFNNIATEEIKVRFLENKRKLNTDRIINFETKKDEILKINKDSCLNISYSIPYCNLKYSNFNEQKYHFINIPHKFDYREKDFEISFNYLKIDDFFVPFGYYFGYKDNENFYYCYGDNNNDMFYFIQVIAGREIILAEQELCYDFFNKKEGTLYKYKIVGYNNFYAGNEDDPNNTIFFSIDNGIKNCLFEPIIVFEQKQKMFGQENGFIFLNKDHNIKTFTTTISIDEISYESKLNKSSINNKDVGNEEIFFSTCYHNNPDLNNEFMECIDDDNYAIIVACENYEKAENIRNVEGVIENAEKLKQILTEKYLFPEENIFFHKNISRDELENKMNELQYTITNEDVNIMFYFIGHGTIKGEYICSDGKPLTKIALYDYIDKLGNKNNILTIIDACYSGAFKNNQETYNNPNCLLLDTYDKKSRILITSADQKSTTGGVFTKYFVEKLKNNKKRYLSIDELFNSLLGNQDFISENKSDAPTSTIFDKNKHNSGTFFFINKNNFNK